MKSTLFEVIFYEKNYIALLLNNQSHRNLLDAHLVSR